MEIAYFLEAILAVGVGLSGLGTALGGLINAGAGGGTPQALAGLAIYFATWAYFCVRVTMRGAAQPAAAPAHGGAAKQA